MPLNKNKKTIIIFLFLILAFLVVLYCFVLENKNSELKVSFLDIGQGDAIFIEALNGNQVLIDGGPDNKVLRSLSKVLPFYDRTIDFVISTHPDCDHIGGLPAVFKRYKVLNSGSTKVSSDALCFGEYKKAIQKEDAQQILLKRGMNISLGNKVNLKVLFPDRVFSGSGIDPNVASVVLLLNYGKSDFLLTADAPKKIEKYILLLENGDIDVDVLKLGHHGSKTSTSNALLGFVSPDYAVISAGEDNSYNHPHKEVLRKLDDFGIDILQTKNLGNITFKSNGREIELIK